MTISILINYSVQKNTELTWIIFVYIRLWGIISILVIANNLEILQFASNSPV
jgi:hypothetical protein